MHIGEVQDNMVRYVATRGHCAILLVLVFPIKVLAIGFKVGFRFLVLVLVLVFLVLLVLLVLHVAPAEEEHLVSYRIK